MKCFSSCCCCFFFKKDLFPGVDCPRIGHPDFNDAVKHVLQTDGFILMPDQVTYIIYYILDDSQPMLYNMF
jgi:hypothetical protein